MLVLPGDFDPEFRISRTVLLSITNRTPDATDLGHLLHKHPARCHEVAISPHHFRLFPG